MPLPIIPLIGAGALALLAMRNKGRQNKGAQPKTKEDINDGVDDKQENEDIVDDIADDLIADVVTGNKSAPNTSGIASAAGEGAGVATGVGGIVQQVATALGASTTGAIILSTGAVVAVTCLFLFGWIAAVVAVVVTTVVFVTDLIAEEIRAREDQAAGGPVKRWREMRDGIQYKVQRKVQLQFSLSEADRAAYRIAEPFSDGFAEQVNTLARKRWQNTPWSTPFMGADAHYAYGWYLGKFLKDHEIQPLMRSAALDTEQKLAGCPVDQRGPGPVDAYWPKCRDMGRLCSNAVAYVQHMKGPHGVGIGGDQGHAQWGLEKGFFLGEVLSGTIHFTSMEGGQQVAVESSGGVLKYMNKMMYYKDVNGNIGLFIAFDDVEIGKIQKAIETQGRDLAAVVNAPPAIKIVGTINTGYTVQPVGTAPVDMMSMISKQLAPVTGTISKVDIASAVQVAMTSPAPTTTTTIRTTTTLVKSWDAELKKYTYG